MRLRIKKFQAKFFDQNPGLYPWPKVLRNYGFGLAFKPREVKISNYFDVLDLRDGAKCLDVGCGTGMMLDRLRKTYGIRGVGVDVSRESILKAREESDKSLRFLLADATKLPFEEETFDFVFSFDTLEHTDMQEKALEEMMRVLKKEGKLLLYTINRNNFLTWNWLLDKIGVDVYERVAHDPDLFVDPDEVRRFFDRKGLITKKIELFDSFFTLIVDEIIMLSVVVLDKTKLHNKGRWNQRLGIAYLKFLTLMSKLSLPFLGFLDAPFVMAKRSNSFFLLAEKSGLDGS
jgi:SAM-dependent methyltransferase